MSVTLISWLAILYGVFVLGVVVLVLSTVSDAVRRPFLDAFGNRGLIPLPTEVHLVLGGVVGPTVSVVAGVFMLGGRAWARATFIGWWTIGLMLVLSAYGLSVVFLMNVATYGVVVALLTRRRVSEFFRASASTTSANAAS